MYAGQLKKEKVLKSQHENINTDNAKSILVKFNPDGLVSFSDQTELANAAKTLIMMNLAPDHLKKEGFQAVMAALTLCRQHNLPYSSLNEIASIKGKLGVYGSLLTALAQRDPNYGEIKVMYADKDMNVISLANKNLNAEVYACVIHYKKKTDSDFHEYYFTKDEAQKAGLLGNQTYTKYLKDMLYHKAKIRLLKTEHPMFLNGVESAELLQYEAQVKDVSPVENLNKRLGLGQIEE